MAKASFLKELGRKEKLVPHLNRWFMGDGKHRPTIHLPIELDKEHDDAFHPSSHAVGCAQEMYAALLGHLPEKQFGSDSFKTFANGHMWHRLIYHATADLGFVDWGHVEHEHRVFRGHQGKNLIASGDMKKVPKTLPDGFEWWARGHIDMSRVYVPGYDDPVLVDIKTMNTRHYRLEWPPEPFKSKYLTQVNLYLDWAGLSDAILLCVEIDSGFRMKEIEISRDDALIESVYEKWDRVAEALRAGSPPEHTCSDPANCVAREIYVASVRAGSGREAPGLVGSTS